MRACSPVVCMGQEQLRRRSSLRFLVAAVSSWTWETAFNIMSANLLTNLGTTVLSRNPLINTTTCEASEHTYRKKSNYSQVIHLQCNDNQALQPLRLCQNILEVVFNESPRQSLNEVLTASFSCRHLFSESHQRILVLPHRTMLKRYYECATACKPRVYNLPTNLRNIL